jgi:hypothetical protein
MALLKRINGQNNRFVKYKLEAPVSTGYILPVAWASKHRRSNYSLFLNWKKLFVLLQQDWFHENNGASITAIPAPARKTKALILPQFLFSLNISSLQK